MRVRGSQAEAATACGGTSFRDPVRPQLESLEAAGDAAGTPPAIFEAFTLSRYTNTIRRVARKRPRDAALVLAVTAISSVLFVNLSLHGWPAGLQWLTIAWIVGIPSIAFLFLGYCMLARNNRFLLADPPPAPSATHRTVIFTLVTLGREVAAIERSTRSVLYWTERCQRPDVKTQAWIVVEEPEFSIHAERFDQLRSEGAVILVVPPTYRTAKDTRFKARALQYATEVRAKRGLADETAWVYHQDEETTVGEDTVLGIQEFVLTAKENVVCGSGIILHPLDWTGRATQFQDLTHSFMDFQVLYTMRHRRNLTPWFHGSHILTRADSEAAISWDMGTPSFCEDLLMAHFLREKYGGRGFEILKGFGYENAPFTVPDLLKQRKRWFRSHVYCILKRRDTSLGRKALTVYGTVAWMAALPSVIAMFLAATIGVTSALPALGVFTGIAWGTIVLGYLRGVDLNRDYLPPKSLPIFQSIGNGLAGFFVDAIAPWYAVLAGKTGTHDFIRKDLPAVSTPGASAAGPHSSIGPAH